MKGHGGAIAKVTPIVAGLADLVSGLVVGFLGTHFVRKVADVAEHLMLPNPTVTANGDKQDP